MDMTGWKEVTIRLPRINWKDEKWKSLFHHPLPTPGTHTRALINLTVMRSFSIKLCRLHFDTDSCPTSRPKLPEPETNPLLKEASQLQKAVIATRSKFEEIKREIEHETSDMDSSDDSTTSESTLPPLLKWRTETGPILKSPNESQLRQVREAILFQTDQILMTDTETYLQKKKAELTVAKMERSQRKKRRIENENLEIYVERQLRQPREEASDRMKNIVQMDNDVQLLVKKKCFYTCRMCRRRFRNAQALNIHTRKMHKIQSQINPKVKKDKTEVQLEIYVSLHCENCGQICQGRSELAEHMKIHKVQSNPSTVCIYPCSECGRQFEWKGNLKRHLELVHQIHISRQLDLETEGLHLKLYKCPQSDCTSAFRQKGNLKRHFGNLHGSHRQKEPMYTGDRSVEALEPPPPPASKGREVEKVNLYTCSHPGCSTVYLHKYSLKRHLVQFHGGADASQLNQQMLSRSRRKVPGIGNVNENSNEVDVDPVVTTTGAFTSNSNQMFPCGYCELRFRTNFELIQHMVLLMGNPDHSSASAREERPKPSNTDCGAGFEFEDSMLNRIKCEMESKEEEIVCMVEVDPFGDLPYVSVLENEPLFNPNTLEKSVEEIEENFQQILLLQSMVTMDNVNMKNVNAIQSQSQESQGVPLFGAFGIQTESGLENNISGGEINMDKIVPRPFKCRVCNLTYRHSSNRRNHELKTHKNHPTIPPRTKRMTSAQSLLVLFQGNKVKPQIEIITPTAAPSTTPLPNAPKSINIGNAFISNGNIEKSNLGAEGNLYI